MTETNLNIDRLTQEELIGSALLDEVFSIPYDIDRERAIISLEERAKALGCFEQVKRLIAVYRKELRKLDAENARREAPDYEFHFETNQYGRPIATINNFLQVFRQDRRFESIRFNTLTNAPEKTVNGKVERWTDADDAAAREYIEHRYKFHSIQKCDDAMRIIFSERSYNPAIDLVDSIEWDGESRICTLLCKWMKCEDTPYTREVSRLIFAGGINRLYNPGCKFEDVPVLIGTKQGEGKSTFVRWLALRDEFFAEITDIEGQRGMEAVEGAWICEMGELLALTRAKDVEATKSFLSRQVDHYRRPYDRRTSDNKRSCIFIGTTNRQQFLTDRTGNRRFYPVVVGQNGYEMFDHEEEIKADIRQCWAEARTLYQKGELPSYADRSILEEIRDVQAGSVEDDYRVGMIETYLDGRSETCVIDIWLNALNNPNGMKPSKKDSNEISIIMQSFTDWKKLSKPRRTKEYGPQRCWVREGILPTDSDLPL